MKLTSSFRLNDFHMLGVELCEVDGERDAFMFCCLNMLRQMVVHISNYNEINKNGSLIIRSIIATIDNCCHNFALNSVQIE